MPVALGHIDAKRRRKTIAVKRAQRFGPDLLSSGNPKEGSSSAGERMHSAENFDWASRPVPIADFKFAKPESTPPSS